MKKPLCFDVFCGLGGWSHGFLAEGWDCVGVDIEQHVYGNEHYPAQLVLQDARTIHGKQFRDADCLVMSPPCTEFSYMAMPWSRAKQVARALRGEGEFPESYTGSLTLADLTALFDACFRIQREACEAAGRQIPMVVENVCGAQKWVGKARAHVGSYYFWGDVPALMPGGCRNKLNGQDTHRWEKTGGKHNCGNWSTLAMRKADQSSAGFNRRLASALIAKIPLEISTWIARCFKPTSLSA